MIRAALYIAATAAILIWVKTRPPRHYRCRTCGRILPSRDRRTAHQKWAHPQ